MLKPPPSIPRYVAEPIYRELDRVGGGRVHPNGTWCLVPEIPVGWIGKTSVKGSTVLVKLPTLSTTYTQVKEIMVLRDPGGRHGRAVEHSTPSVICGNKVVWQV